MSESQVEYMVGLIRKEWSDSMSDSGAIWKATYDILQKAKAESPEIYAKALPIAQERGML